MHPAAARPAWRRRDRVRAAASRDGLLPSAGPVLMFLLDTNVLSELRRRKRTRPKVAAWADSVQADDLFPLGHHDARDREAGTLMPARRDAARGAVLRAGFDDKVLPAFAGRTPAIDTPVANQRRRASRTGAEDLLARRHRDGTTTAPARRQGSTRRQLQSQTISGGRCQSPTTPSHFQRSTHPQREPYSGYHGEEARTFEGTIPCERRTPVHPRWRPENPHRPPQGRRQPARSQMQLPIPRRLHPARWQRIGRLQPRLCTPPGPLRRDAGPDAGQHPQPAQSSQPDA